MGIIWPVGALLLVIHEMQSISEARLNLHVWWFYKRCLSLVCLLTSGRDFVVNFPANVEYLNRVFVSHVL